MATSYKDMTIEHLGSEATETDLAAFRYACREYQAAHPDATDLEATDAIWNNGRIQWIWTECAYCNADIPDAGGFVPDVDDDPEWTALEHLHADGCEWVETRAHRVNA